MTILLLSTIAVSIIITNKIRENHTKEVVELKSEIINLNYKVAIKSTLTDSLISIMESDDYLYHLIKKESSIEIPTHVDPKFIRYMYEEAISKNIPIDIMFRLVKKESSFYNNAISPVGAYGFMQLMPRTYRIYCERLNIEQFPYTEEKNIYIGTYMLAELYEHWYNKIQKLNFTDNIEREATSFVNRVIERDANLPFVVGFSGGKDSLAAYLVVEKATGKSPPIFFMDTGLELPETIQFIKSFADKRNVKIIGAKAGNQFWESVDVFGPPARDFRWCCKVLKLGPAATSIADMIGSETVSFMGQRKLESFQRSIEPRVSENPWVPGQISANPIQNWNALEVWLYTFKEKEDYNPLYNRGYHRMGCYLCPSSPLAELESLRQTHPKLHQQWEEKMREWAEKYGFPDEWFELGFWRWKTLPQGQMELVNKLGLNISTTRQSPGEKIELNVTKGVAPCTKSGFSLEGAFTTGLDLNRVSKIMPIFGKTKVSEELGVLRTASGENHISLFSSGSVVVRGPDERSVEKLTEKLERATKRALLCQACGSCVPQCEYGALHLKDGKISVDEEKCSGCLECDNWPCPTYLA